MYLQSATLCTLWVPAGKGFESNISATTLSVVVKLTVVAHTDAQVQSALCTRKKVFKGKRMAGQGGHEQVTVQNLRVVLVDTENQVIGVVGAVPGPIKASLSLKGANQWPYLQLPQVALKLRPP